MIEELPPNEEFRDEEYPDAGDVAPCPRCRAPIYADAERCPSCGDYVTGVAAPRRGRLWWMWVGLALALLVLLWWIL